MKLIGQGDTAEVYRTSNNRVVKLFFNEVTSKDVNREYETVKYIGDKAPFAPKVFKSVKINHRHGYEMEEVVGDLFIDVINKEPNRVRFNAELLGMHHKMLHEYDTSALNLISLRTNMLRYFDHLTAFSKEMIDWAKNIISSLPSGNSVLHGDYMPYNLMYIDQKLQAMDWSDVMTGHGDADVARTLYFIIDPSDYKDALYTLRHKEFVNSYLNGYYGNEIPYEILHKWLLVNAMIEYEIAVEDNELTDYMLKLKDFIDSNYREMYSEWLFNRE